MKNEDIILSAVKENTKMLTNLNREVGEIKAEMATKGKERAKGYTKIGIFISSGMLLSKIAQIIGIC